MMKCLPLIWPELAKSKLRVESVFNGLNMGAVKYQTALELKKGLVNNQALKEYFFLNPAEKEMVLTTEVKNEHSGNDQKLFRSLDVMPAEVIPKEMLAVNSRQIAECGIGQHKQTLKASDNSNLLKLSQNLVRSGIQTTFVKPDHPATIVRNMIGFPAAVERYNNRAKSAFSFDNPATKDIDASEPTKRSKI